MSHKQPFFGPHPPSDPQIDPLRPHLEKFPACGAQRVPAALPLPAAAEGMRCSTTHAKPRPWQMGPFFFGLRRREGLGKEKKFFSADHSKHTRRLLLAEHCWFSRSRELATGRPLALALVGNSRRSARREAAAEHKEHGVEHGVISGGEQARTHELPSSRDRHLQLEPKIFGLRRRASEQAGTRASDPRRFRAAAREQQIAPAAHMENFFGLRPMQLACFYTTDQTCVFQHTSL